MMAVLIATTILWYPIYFATSSLILYFHPVLVIHVSRYGRDIDFRITDPPNTPRPTESVAIVLDTTPLRLYCPLCGWQMRKCDVQAYGFRCPGCKELLRFADFRGARLVGLVSLLGGYLLSYLTGSRGNELVCGGLVDTYLVFFAILFVHARFFRKLVKDTRKHDDGFLHIVEPPSPAPPAKKQ